MINDSRKGIKQGPSFLFIFAKLAGPFITRTGGHSYSVHIQKQWVWVQELTRDNLFEV